MLPVEFANQAFLHQKCGARLRKAHNLDRFRVKFRVRVRVRG